MDMEVKCLDSPGTSSGYCSGTEEEIALTVAMLNSPLPSGSSDVFPGSFYHPQSTLESLDTAGLESLISDYGTSSLSGPHPSQAELEATTSYDEIPEAGFEERNFREVWDSWLHEMLNGNPCSDSSRNEAFDLASIDLDPCLELLSVLQEHQEGPSQNMLTVSLNISDTTGEPERNLEFTNQPSAEYWSSLFEDWENEGSDVVQFGEDLSGNYFWESIPDNFAVPCSSPDHSTSSPKGKEMRQLPKSDRISNISHGHEKEPERNLNQLLTPRHQEHPSSTKRKAETSPSAHDEAVRSKICLRTRPSPQNGPGANTIPSEVKPIVYHGLEDHRYSSRSNEAPLVRPSGASSSRDKDTKPVGCSVLEALLRTSIRLNPNKGSSALFCKESKKRSLTPSSGITQHPKQPRPSGHQAQATLPGRHQNTLLHNLLTCRMEEVERGRQTSRDGKTEVGRRMAEVEGLTPPDNPAADCSFLFEDQESETEFQDSEFEAKMAWSDSRASKENQTAHYATDDETDTWFTSYFSAAT